MAKVPKYVLILCNLAKNSLSSSVTLICSCFIKLYYMFTIFVMYFFGDSCGHYSTSSCQLCLILMRSSMSGSQKTLKIMQKTSQPLTKVFH